MGFQERNGWACGCSILVVFTPYFWVVFRYPMVHVGLFAIAVAALVALLVGFHIVNALVTASIRNSGDAPAPDELDRMIELRAAKLAGMVLAMAVLSWSMATMVGVPVQGVANLVTATGEHAVTPPDFAIQVAKVMCWVHVLFAGFVISNVAYYGSIIVGYRRLADG